MYDYDLPTATSMRLLNTMQFLAEEVILKRCANDNAASEKAEARRKAIYAELATRLGA
ncbi:MAG: hypothetical protein ACRDS9_15310 [Pseudonocardiaceae bacterium]